MKHCDITARSSLIRITQEMQAVLTTFTCTYVISVNDKTTWSICNRVMFTEINLQMLLNVDHLTDIFQKSTTNELLKASVCVFECGRRGKDAVHSPLLS